MPSEFGSALQRNQRTFSMFFATILLIPYQQCLKADQNDRTNRLLQRRLNDWLGLSVNSFSFWLFLSILIFSSRSSYRLCCYRYMLCIVIRSNLTDHYHYRITLYCQSSLSDVHFVHISSVISEFHLIHLQLYLFILFILFIISIILFNSRKSHNVLAYSLSHLGAFICSNLTHIHQFFIDSLRSFILNHVEPTSSSYARCIRIR